MGCGISFVGADALGSPLSDDCQRKRAIRESPLRILSRRDSLVGFGVLDDPCRANQCALLFSANPHRTPSLVILSAAKRSRRIPAPAGETPRRHRDEHCSSACWIRCAGGSRTTDGRPYGWRTPKAVRIRRSTVYIREHSAWADDIRPYGGDTAAPAACLQKICFFAMNML